MHRNNYATLLLATLLFSTGCRYTSQPLDTTGIEGTWTLYDVTPQHPESVDENSEALMQGAKEVGSILSLFADSSFTKTEGNGEYTNGSWYKVADSNRTVLTTRKGGDTTQTALTVEAPWIEQPHYTLVMPGGEFLYRYVKTAAPLKNYKEDPFYHTNNWWRVTPKKPEDSAHVRDRFGNYLKHLALLLKASEERQQKTISFEYSQGAVMIYNGGIGALPFDTIKRSWKNGFYDDVSAQYAYMLFGQYLQQNRYTGKSTGSWVEDDYRILKWMYPAFHTRRKRVSR